MAQKKILVIYTGGTFGMRTVQKNLVIPELTPKQLKSWLKDQVPEMAKIARCDVDILFNTDSCQIQAGHWFELAAHIFKKQNQYHGVVILHGTDTLAYSAAALSALLSPARIPVVFTGAQKPLSALRNDARLNFISAIEVAANAPTELRNRVMVVFHDELFLGSRVRKKSAVDFAAFESPRFPKLATIGSEIQYQEIIHHLPKLRGKKPLLAHFRASRKFQLLPQILSAQVTPQFCAPLFNDEFLVSLDAILLTLYTSGTAPTEQESFIRFLEKAYSHDTPILAITEREDEIASLKTYASGRELVKQKVMWCEDLTPEAAFVKIWLLRELHRDLAKPVFFNWLKKNWPIPLSDEVGV